MKRKLRKSKLWKTGLAAILAGAMVTGLIPLGGSNPVEVKAAGTAPETKNINLNIQQSDASYKIAGINDPNYPNDRKAWSGTKVYYGKHGGAPILFRVLDADTTDYNSSHTMFLDCDTVLEKRKFQKNTSGANINAWATSDIRAWMQGKETGDFLNGFTAVEQNAIASSTRTSMEVEGLSSSTSSRFSWCSLNDDTVFALDAREASNPAYGYSTGHYWIDNRLKEKEGFSSIWWLRSVSSSVPDSAAGVNDIGTIPYSPYVVYYEHGVSPAFNLKLSSVLFTSASSIDKSSSFAVTSASSSKTWNLTLAGGTGFTADLAGIGKVENGSTVTVTVSDIGTADTGVSYGQLSAMLADENGTVMAYGKVKDSASTGDVTITLPDNLTVGADYTLKIFAEDVRSSASANLTDYASNMVDIPLTVADGIALVEISDITAPVSGEELDTEAVCATIGVADAIMNVPDSAEVKWKTGTADAAGSGYVTGKADYDAVHTAEVTLTADRTHQFIPAITAKVNGETATDVKLNNDGTLTVTYTFGTTDKAELLDIRRDLMLNVEHGTELADMNLPATVGITIRNTAGTDMAEATADVDWHVDTPTFLENTSYDIAKLEKQVFVLEGDVVCPGYVDSGSYTADLKTNLIVTVSEAGAVAAPEVNLPEGEYKEVIEVELSSATEGAEIRYSLATGDSDPGVPAATSMKYEKPIRLTADAGQSVVWKIAAVAMKDGMKDSEVKKFTYTISVPEIPVETYQVTVNNGTGSGEYAEGETVTICVDVTNGKAGDSNNIDDTVSGNVPQRMRVMLTETGSTEADVTDAAATAVDAAADSAAAKEADGSTETDVGREFQEWQVVKGNIVLADSKSAETTFVMPAEDVEITAVFKDGTDDNKPDDGDKDDNKPGNGGDSNGGQDSGHDHNYEWKVVNEATAGQDGEEIYYCTICGNITARQSVSSFGVYNKDVLAKITTAAQGAIVEIDTDTWMSYPAYILKELEQRPDVTLVTKFRYKGKKYSFTIPARTDAEGTKAPKTKGNEANQLTEEGVNWYGYLYLGGKYGMTEITAK